MLFVCFFFVLQPGIHLIRKWWLLISIRLISFTRQVKSITKKATKKVVIIYCQVAKLLARKLQNERYLKNLKIREKLWRFWLKSSPLGVSQNSIIIVKGLYLIYELIFKVLFIL